MYMYQLSGTEHTRDGDCPLYQRNFITPNDAKQYASDRLFLRKWIERKTGRLWEIITNDRTYRIELKNVKGESDL